MILTVIFFSLLLGIISLFLIPQNKIKIIKLISLSLAGFILVVSSVMFSLFNSNKSTFQFVTEFSSINSTFLNIDFSFGIDGIAIYFFFLTTFLSFLCIIFIWDEADFKSYSILLFILELLLLLTFSVLNLFLFYVFFECILIPIYLIIGLWGSREKKIRASYLLFFYTICGSLLLLIAILYIYSVTGTFNFEYLQIYPFNFDQQTFLWFAFFLSFASKIPMFPFHIWLPEAHVEAPTLGSVLLAGILLKLGVYGFLRYSLALFPQACIYFSPLVYVLGIIGVVYASLTAIKQTDLKKIIAYSSIAHMNLVVLGIFSGNVLGLEAAVLQSISHGFVSSALFFLIGMLYNRYHSRLLFYYGGIAQIMPLYTSFFLFFTMSNIALPGTSSFIGEFLLLAGLFQESIFCSIFAGFSVVLSGAYSLWLYNRVSFGNLKSEILKFYSDLSFREFFILILLLLTSLYLGLLPYKFLGVIHLSIVKLFIISNVAIL
jgi:proton-translocating NADH-quinone oxidoreductase chain M